MDPKWVLTNDEKRIRFRNFNKKKTDRVKTSQIFGTTSKKPRTQIPDSDREKKILFSDIGQRWAKTDSRFIT